MDVSGFDEVWFTDSYVLGWERKGAELFLHVELLLSDCHPNFEPYDKRKEYGCYKLGRILISGVGRVAGLHTDSMPLKWGDDLGEYVDVAEIHSVNIRDGKLIIETDNLDRVEIEGDSCEVVFD